MIFDIVWMRVGLYVGLLGSLVAGQLPEASAQSDPSGFDTVINAPPTIIGENESIGSNTQLNVFDDPNVEFEVGSGLAVGSSVTSNIEVNLFSGVIDSNFSFNTGFRLNAGSTTNIFGGQVRGRLDANAGSVLSISGGNITGNVAANEGSSVFISGGEFGPVNAGGGSNVEIAGGLLEGFGASRNSVVTISGGTFDSNFNIQPDSDVTIRGGEFLLNGIPLANPATVTITTSGGLTLNDSLTGTLEDGSVFVFSPRVQDRLISVVFETVALPAIDLTPIVVENALDVAPAGLRAGQSLTLRGDGALGPDFATVDATLNIEGGSVDSDIEVAGSTVTISDGGATSLIAFPGSEINLSGGKVGRLMLLESSAEISGGSLGSLEIGSGSVLDVTGGEVGIDLSFFSISVDVGGTLNVFGGSFIGSVGVSSGGEFNLHVTEAFIDGAPIDGLLLGEPLTILERGQVLLTGLLADGSEFSFELFPFGRAIGGDFFEPATVTVTLVSPVLLGDVNQDEVVNFSDIPSFIEALQAGVFIPEADCNQDGAVNFSDIPRFVEILQAQ